MPARIPVDDLAAARQSSTRSTESRSRRSQLGSRRASPGASSARASPLTSSGLRKTASQLSQRLRAGPPSRYGRRTIDRWQSGHRRSPGGGAESAPASGDAPEPAIRRVRAEGSPSKNSRKVPPQRGHRSTSTKPSAPSGSVSGTSPVGCDNEASVAYPRDETGSSWSSSAKLQVRDRFHLGPPSRRSRAAVMTVA
jgi:hypothetical protein